MAANTFYKHVENVWDPAWVTYERGFADCKGLGILACYLLEKNGWDAWLLTVEPEGTPGPGTPGHAGCTYKGRSDPNSIYDFWGWVPETGGPYSSFEEIGAEWYDCGKPEGPRCSIKIIRASQITEPTRSGWDPAQWDLPWIWITKPW